MKKTAATSIALSLIWVSAVARGQGQTPPGLDRVKVISAVRDVMRKAGYCGLITVGEDGHPQARVVDPLFPEEDLTVWIATNPATRKVGQIRKDSRVTLFYFDRGGPSTVTLLGKADLVRAPEEKAKHWKEEWAPFYKDGYRGDDFVLIRVRPSRLEVVSDAHGLRGDTRTWRPVTLELP